jgi:hypothetical protein
MQRYFFFRSTPGLPDRFLKPINSLSALEDLIAGNAIKILVACNHFRYWIYITGFDHGTVAGLIILLDT